MSEKARGIHVSQKDIEELINMILSNPAYHELLKNKVIQKAIAIYLRKPREVKKKAKELPKAEEPKKEEKKAKVLLHL